MNHAVYGTCTNMCPEEEMRFRESQKLLHIFEMVPGTVGLPKPKADRNRIVKKYTRSAAGLDMALPKNLRTTEALLQTVGYLLHDVISMKDVSWHVIYDFIADRFLAVRQDMLIQRLPKSHYICLLQPIIRFYAYAAYRLCELPVAKFDPVLNNIQLQECLKNLLTCYDDHDNLKLECLFSQNLHITHYECVYADDRAFFEALYIIFNLGDISAILRGLSLDTKWRTDIVVISLQASMAARNGNWYRTCFLIRELPALLAAVASLHLPRIRRDALKKMSVSYNSKNLKYPINALKKQLLYSDNSIVIADCNFYNITVDGEAVKFTKDCANFKNLVKPIHEKFVVDKMSGRQMTELVLEGNA